MNPFNVVDQDDEHKKTQKLAESGRFFEEKDSSRFASILEPRDDRPPQKPSEKSIVENPLANPNLLHFGNSIKQALLSSAR